MSRFSVRPDDPLFMQLAERLMDLTNRGHHDWVKEMVDQSQISADVATAFAMATSVSLLHLAQFCSRLGMEEAFVMATMETAKGMALKLLAQQAGERDVSRDN